MRTEAVFFDLYETLITEFEDGRRRSKRAYDYDGLLGLSAETFKAEWSARQTRRMNGTFRDYPDVLRDILAARGLAVDDRAVRFLHESRLEEKRIPFAPIREDVLALLARLRAQGIKLGLISNCAREEVDAWESSELAPHFADRVFSFEAGCSKPDEAIYRLACGRMGVRPEACVFVGDGGSRELEGAERAGMRAFHAYWYNTHIESAYPKLTAPLELLRVLG
ncbi:HAD family hydrolase [Paenibacillus sp. MWE-103]|uniref:HAD family hydrolase n=2 Tax=Paenibacillus artemisiicola TaxID=1172618 RepID=A0ABS3W311_9BACL|nr:HAD family hydrolase [Paenibacillus artemisiicola]